MTIRPLTRRQRIRMGDILEKLAVGTALAAIAARELSPSDRGWGMMIAFVTGSLAVWLEGSRRRRI